MQPDEFDVAIVGGGLIGAACADYLSGDGLRVCVLDKGPLVREASWAGAGILFPIQPWQYPAPLQPLLRAAVLEYPSVVDDLEQRTGAQVELENSGLVVVPGDSEAENRWISWAGEVFFARSVDLREVEPAARDSARGVFFETASHVRSHLLARAFLASARHRGARLFPFRAVTAIQPGRLDTVAGPVVCERAVLCAGAWSAGLLPGLDVEPVRGQILLYERKIERMVVFGDGTYAVPRRDGLTLVGSTLERVGFEGAPTEDAAGALAKRAADLLGFRPAELRAAWAGLRPATCTLLPWFGSPPGRPDLTLATGHYRNGILLGPLSGRLVADLVGNRDHGFNLCAFRPPVGAGDGLSETDIPC